MFFHTFKTSKRSCMTLLTKISKPGLLLFVYLFSQWQYCITDMDNWMSANRLKLNMDKTELLWAGTRYKMSMLNDSGPSLQLNNVTVKASQHVRVLRVHLSSDLSLDKHVSSVSAT